jgi:hypothetical protein
MEINTWDQIEPALTKVEFVKLYLHHVAGDKIFSDDARSKRIFLQRVRSAEELYEFYERDEDYRDNRGSTTRAEVANRNLKRQ